MDQPPKGNNKEEELTNEALLAKLKKLKETTEGIKRNISSLEAKKAALGEEDEKETEHENNPEEPEVIELEVDEGEKGNPEELNIEEGKINLRMKPRLTTNAVAEKLAEDATVDGGEEEGEGDTLEGEESEKELIETYNKLAKAYSKKYTNKSLTLEEVGQALKDLQVIIDLAENNKSIFDEGTILDLKNKKEDLKEKKSGMEDKKDSETEIKKYQEEKEKDSIVHTLVSSFGYKKEELENLSPRELKNLYNRKNTEKIAKDTYEEYVNSPYDEDLEEKYKKSILNNAKELGKEDSEKAKLYILEETKKIQEAKASNLEKIGDKIAKGVNKFAQYGIDHIDKDGNQVKYTKLQKGAKMLLDATIVAAPAMFINPGQGISTIARKAIRKLGLASLAELPFMKNTESSYKKALLSGAVGVGLTVATGGGVLLATLFAASGTLLLAVKSIYIKEEVTNGTSFTEKINRKIRKKFGIKGLTEEEIKEKVEEAKNVIDSETDLDKLYQATEELQNFEKKLSRKQALRYGLQTAAKMGAVALMTKGVDQGQGQEKDISIASNLKEKLFGDNEEIENQPETQKVIEVDLATEEMKDFKNMEITELPVDTDTVTHHPEIESELIINDNLDNIQESYKEGGNVTEKSLEEVAEPSLSDEALDEPNGSLQKEIENEGNIEEESTQENQTNTEEEAKETPKETATKTTTQEASSSLNLKEGESIDIPNESVIKEGRSGITYAFRDQLRADHQLAKTLGVDMDKINDNSYMADFTKDLAVKTGYISEEGHEVRVAVRDKVAYVLHEEGGGPVVIEAEIDPNDSRMGNVVEINKQGSTFEPDTKDGIEKDYEYSKDKTYSYGTTKDDSHSDGLATPQRVDHEGIYSTPIRVGIQVDTDKYWEGTPIEGLEPQNMTNADAWAEHKEGPLKDFFAKGRENMTKDEIELAEKLRTNFLLASKEDPGLYKYIRSQPKLTMEDAENLYNKILNKGFRIGNIEDDYITPASAQGGYTEQSTSIDTTSGYETGGDVGYSIRGGGSSELSEDELITPVRITDTEDTEQLSSEEIAIPMRNIAQKYDYDFNDAEILEANKNYETYIKEVFGAKGENDIEWLEIKEEKADRYLRDIEFADDQEDKFSHALKELKKKTRLEPNNTFFRKESVESFLTRNILEAKKQKINIESILTSISK